MNHAAAIAALPPPPQRWRKYRPQRRLTVGPLVILAAVLNLAVVLAAFLILKSQIVLQPGIKLQLPTASFTDGMPSDALLLVATQEGLVFFDDTRVPLADLANAFSRAVHEHPDCKLIIQADLRVQYGTVVRIVNTAMAAGIQQIMLAVRPAFGEEIAP